MSVEAVSYTHLSFGVGGWVRLSYCIARDTIERSMPAFKALKESYEAKLSS